MPFTETYIKRKMTFVLLMVATDKSEKIFIKKTEKQNKKKTGKLKTRICFSAKKSGHCTSCFVGILLKRAFLY